MLKVCYLCGLEIVENISDDHVIPQQLIKRKQPKVKGFDYGGVLPSHEVCNNQFGPETYCSSALKLITKLHDPKCVGQLKNQRNLVLNSDCFKGFTKRDLSFFNIIDFRGNSSLKITQQISSLGIPQTNPINNATNTILAVLAKSAAALLIKRNDLKIPEKWKILSITYTGSNDSVCFDQLFGDTKPVDIGVKVWVKKCESNDFIAIYKLENLLVFFLFQISLDNEYWNRMIERFYDGTKLCFEGVNLNALINYKWKKVN